jgi:NADH-quinone oxidoreductase subunit L
MGVTGAVMTAFYMFRLYFLVFHGEFRGWRVVLGWKDPHDHHHDAHGHGHAPSGPVDGPAPHESPWPMTVPLLVLAFFAAVGGFLNAHPLHITPLEHWVEPLFASSVDPARLLHSDPEHQLMVPLLIPGVLAFLIGSSLAFYMYVLAKGAPAQALAERFPALHQLLYEKWRVDELYDEVVVGSLESLADAAVWFDRWVVDGIIARLTALIVTLWGHLLRTFQTGHAQAYAAAMVVGMFGIGWFIGVPQPKAVVSGDQATGQYIVQAAPGLGYAYRWDTNGDGTYDTEAFGGSMQVTLTLDEGASQEVGLQVRNAFGRVRGGTYHVERPRRDASGAALDAIPSNPRTGLMKLGQLTRGSVQ